MGDLTDGLTLKPIPGPPPRVLPYEYSNALSTAMADGYYTWRASCEQAL